MTVGAEWIVSTSASGRMRLLVAAPPPWPVAVRAAARLVDQLDACCRADRDEEAADAARELESIIRVLEADGIAARLAS